MALHLVARAEVRQAASSSRRYAAVTTAVAVRGGRASPGFSRRAPPAPDGLGPELGDLRSVVRGVRIEGGDLGEPHRTRIVRAESAKHGVATRTTEQCFRRSAGVWAGQPTVETESGVPADSPPHAL
jgi:hypothetical protein